jgi:hypothetical protein
VTQHHDPVHPDSPHLSVELVADLDEGLLDPESAAHAEHHLAHCPSCAQVRQALADVTGSLGSLPPVPMPADRAATLDAALAALAGSAAPPADQPPAPQPPDTVVPLDAARRRRAGWSTRVVTAAASVAGVLLVSAVGYSLLSSGSGDAGGALEADGTANGGATPLTDQVVAEQSGRAYRKATLDQQVNTLLVSHSTPLTSTPTPSPTATDSDASPTPEPYVTATVSSSPTTFRAAIVDPAVLRTCLVDYLGLTDTAPLAVDVGTFNGAPAAVVVIPDASDPAQAWVYVVDPNCSGPDATLLYWAVVDLPKEEQ